MRVMLFLLFPILGFIFSRNSQTNDCFEYPKQIVELNSIDVYDSARWVLFNWLGSKKLDGVYYGQMDLKFKYVSVSYDTMVIYFNFLSADPTSADKRKVQVVANASVTVELVKRKCIWAFNYPFEDFSSNLSTGDKELESAPSAKTITFLKTQPGINECFLELAKRKKLLE